MLHITMIGCGAIGVGVLELLENDPQLCVDYVIASEGSEALVRQRLASFKQPPQVLTALPADARPDLLVECAGHRAIEEHVLPALERGIACLIVSVGALSEVGLVERLEAAADDPAVVTGARLAGDEEQIAEFDALREQERLVIVGGGDDAFQHREISICR